MNLFEGDFPSKVSLLVDGSPACGLFLMRTALMSLFEYTFEHQDTSQTELEFTLMASFNLVISSGASSPNTVTAEEFKDVNWTLETSSVPQMLCLTNCFLRY